MELNSEKIDKLIPALIAARKVITGVKKGENNPFFKSKYANLTSIIQCVNQPLLDNDLIITQPTQVNEGQLLSVTQLTHASGQWIRGYLPIINKKGDDQGQGSGLTYARRYGLQSLLNIPAFDDDAELTKAKESGVPVMTGAEGAVVASSPAAPPPIQLITKAQRESFYKHVKSCDVSEDEAKSVLKRYGYAKTTEIPAERFEFLKSQIKFASQKAKMGKI
jgi:hypothetical protein|tara:strand:- start:16 stop:678 length:663 start_codon:yes stop_codon:yes gene_type:complete